MLNQVKNVIITGLMALSLFGSVAFAGIPVNVNTATAQQIAENLKGIGSSKAAAIVAYRDANGGFKHPDELINVKGIGLSIVDKNRELIMVNEEK